MIETALLFDKDGQTIHFRPMDDCSAGYIPDSRDFWYHIWDNRDRLAGIAHTHPWWGQTGPSHTDVTTFAAIERGLGARLVWPIVTFSHVQWFYWMGPGEYDYRQIWVDEPGIVLADVREMRKRSGIDTAGPNDVRRANYAR